MSRHGWVGSLACVPVRPEPACDRGQSRDRLGVALGDGLGVRKSSVTDKINLDPYTRALAPWRASVTQSGINAPETWRAGCPYGDPSPDITQPTSPAPVTSANAVSTDPSGDRLSCRGLSVRTLRSRPRSRTKCALAPSPGLADQNPAGRCRCLHGRDSTTARETFTRSAAAAPEGARSSAGLRRGVSFLLRDSARAGGAARACDGRHLGSMPGTVRAAAAA